MHILFIAWRDLAHPNAGGSEVVVDALANGLRDRGHEVSLLCGGPIAARPYEIVESGGTYSQYLLTPARYLRRFRHVDVVVDVANGVPYFSPLWRRGPRVCFVHHVHTEQWAQYFPRPIASTASFVERHVVPLVYRNTRFIAVSPSTADELVDLGIDATRIHVAPNGVTVAGASEEFARSAQPMFLALGRLAANKRLGLLLDLWARVSPAVGGRLVIAGDGPDAAAISARLQEDPRLANVVLVGRVSEAQKAELLAEAWFLVHTAEREGWGLVILEAATCGTPTLAFNVPGVRDTVENGRTGILVEDEEAFVENWISLAENETLRRRLGTAAAKHASQYTWERSVDVLLEAVGAVVSESNVTRAEHDSASAEERTNRVVPGRSRGLRRTIRLLQLFRREGSEPDAFYHYLAEDTVNQLRGFADLRGTRAIDIGGGPGYTAEALKSAGASCAVIEYQVEELLLHDRHPDGAMQADAQALPIPSSSVQIVHSSNVLEHVPDWRAMLSEMIRVLEPDVGTGFLSFTNWLSPWGGHETSPWHYLGGRRAVERYKRRHGRLPKNEFGVGLYRVSISEVLEWFRTRSDVEVLWAGSRYMPASFTWLTRVPGLREIVTWNLVVVFRRRDVNADGQNT